YSDALTSEIEETFDGIDKDRSGDFQYDTISMDHFQTSLRQLQKNVRRLPNHQEFLDNLRNAFDTQEMIQSVRPSYVQLSGEYEDARELAMHLRDDVNSLVRSRTLSIDPYVSCIGNLWEWIEDKGFKTLEQAQDMEEKYDTMKIEYEMIKEEHDKLKGDNEKTEKDNEKMEMELKNTIKIQQKLVCWLYFYFHNHIISSLYAIQNKKFFKNIEDAEDELRRTQNDYSLLVEQHRTTEEEHESLQQAYDAISSRYGPLEKDLKEKEKELESFKSKWEKQQHEIQRFEKKF
ncbi:viral A-type inclusion protein, partial [Reticulomyxa filosa]